MPRTYGHLTLFDKGHFAVVTNLRISGWQDLPGLSGFLISSQDPCKREAGGSGTRPERTGSQSRRQGGLQVHHLMAEDTARSRGVPEACRGRRGQGDRFLESLPKDRGREPIYTCGHQNRETISLRCVRPLHLPITYYGNERKWVRRVTRNQLVTLNTHK